MFDVARPIFLGLLDEMRTLGVFKDERVLEGPQGVLIKTGGREVRNFCANNYLGLSSHPDVIRAATEALASRGYGLSSVRFICGTQDGHRALESRLAGYLGMEDAILYSSCFDANAGVFEALLGEEDAIISDALNHASIIDGIRLSKAERHRYANGDMTALAAALQQTAGKRLRLIATDGVFSMDGSLARLDAIVTLADKYGAMVLVDDSHATGFVGPAGRGTADHFRVHGRVDLITSTFGKALGGASGGFIAGHAPIIDVLRQRSRPYLFSNTLAPPMVAGALAALDVLDREPWRRQQVMENARHFRDAMAAAGFVVREGFHPIVPVMLGDAALATRFAREMLEEGVYVIGFSYPVVPRGEARIRVQLSAAHSAEDINAAVAAFAAVGRRLGVLGGRSC